MKMVNISDETKARFDTLQRALSFKKNHDLSQDEVLQELLKFWNDYGGDKQ